MDRDATALEADLDHPSISLETIGYRPSRLEGDPLPPSALGDP